MALTTTPVFPQGIHQIASGDGFQTFVNADGTTNKALLVATTNGTRVTGISITSSDSAVRYLSLYVKISTTSYLIGTVTVPANAGNGTGSTVVVSVSGLSSTNLPYLSVDNNGNLVLDLPNGATLTAQMFAAVTAAATVTVVVLGRDF